MLDQVIYDKILFNRKMIYLVNTKYNDCLVLLYLTKYFPYFAFFSFYLLYIAWLSSFQED